MARPFGASHCRWPPPPTHTPTQTHQLVVVVVEDSHTRRHRSPLIQRRLVVLLCLGRAEGPCTACCPCATQLSVNSCKYGVCGLPAPIPLHIVLRPLTGPTPRHTGIHCTRISTYHRTTWARSCRCKYDSDFWVTSHPDPPPPQAHKVDTMLPRVLCALSSHHATATCISGYCIALCCLTCPAQAPHLLHLAVIELSSSSHSSNL